MSATHTWRDFVSNTALYWYFPDVNLCPAPDNDTRVEGYAAIAAFLGIGERTLIDRAEALCIPLLVQLQKPSPGSGLPTFHKPQWRSQRDLRMHCGPDAVPVTTSHALTLWIALNDVYAAGRIAACTPGAH